VARLIPASEAASIAEAVQNAKAGIEAGDVVVQSTAIQFHRGPTIHKKASSAQNQPVACSIDAPHLTMPDTLIGAPDRR